MIVPERRDNMDFGNKIMKLRKQLGLSQEELAEKLGVARQTISKWELGETAPDLKQSKELSKIFNVSLDELTDNDIKEVLVEKVSNTEKTSKKTLSILKILATAIIVFILLFIVLVIAKIIYRSTRERGRKIEETIYCDLYGEKHTFSIEYYELTGLPIALGGDPYFSDILDLGKYNDAHQIFNVINDYVKKNGGTCSMSKDKELNDLVEMTIKEGTLTKTSATVVIKGNIYYDITLGETFWIEKYNEYTNEFKKLENTTGKNCAFNLPAYVVTSDKPLELKQDWSCEHGELSKGTYRLVKDVDYEDNVPVSPQDKIIWVEFEIEE